ncbi:MAG: hypothetical protein JW986_06440 [Methanotrichaceae archaeon]|nr:hypothetical protein [Methanotrichaceae archaeon]
MNRILVLLALGLLISATQGATEQMNVGPYSISFELNGSDEYNITARDDFFHFDVIVSSESVQALISGYLEPGSPIPDLGQESRNILDILLDLGITDAQPYVVDIGGREGVMGVSNSSKSGMIFIASSAEYLEEVNGTLNLEVISAIPWEYGTKEMLESLDVRYDPTSNPATAERWDPNILLFRGYIAFTGGDGSSTMNAVEVQNAFGDRDGVAAEYYYLGKHFGQQGTNWDLEGQSLVTEGDRYYDKMDLNITEASSRTVYFDITGFYGEIA